MNPNQKDPYDILSSKIEDFLNDRTSTFRWKRQSERCSICLGKISLCFLPSDINLKTHIWAIRESYIGSDDCYDVYSFDKKTWTRISIPRELNLEQKKIVLFGYFTQENLSLGFSVLDVISEFSGL